jgi:hypothetical protein
MVWHNGWALLLEVGEYVFKLVLSSSFFLKEPLVSILTCLKKVVADFPHFLFWKKIQKNSKTFKSSLNQVQIKNCEGMKFYNKLKP